MGVKNDTKKRRAQTKHQFYILNQSLNNRVNRITGKCHIAPI